MINIDDFLFERLEINKDSKIKGAFASRRRNKIDSSKERKAYLKFIEFFKALGEMPELIISLGNIKDNNFDAEMTYKVKYSEDLKNIPENDSRLDHARPTKYKDFLGWIIAHLDSYKDVINYYFGAPEYIFSLCIYKDSLDEEEIEDIDGLNLFNSMRLRTYDNDEVYVISFKDLIENIDKIYDLFG